VQPEELIMSDDKKPEAPVDDKATKPGVTPVDKDTQEDAAEERKETGGYQ
jgi:hypothetical protein